MKFQIRYALDGGFGGCKKKDWEDCDAKTEEKANKIAYELACEEYDETAGMYGIKTLDDIMQDYEGCTPEEAMDMYLEDRESWVDYEVRQVENDE